jgi:hypothetical protein
MAGLGIHGLASSVLDDSDTSFCVGDDSQKTVVSVDLVDLAAAGRETNVSHFFIKGF